MLGDTAVAVNPEDKRYNALIGKNIKLPLTDRLIPVVGDDSVDPEFGTGAVKVTPSHDFNDEATARRHNLPFLKVMTEDGRMNAEAGADYAGLDRMACRKKVVENLKKLELLDTEKKHKHSVGHCYRCKTVIEPYDTIQWYVKIEPLAREAIKSVEERNIYLVPEGGKTITLAGCERSRIGVSPARSGGGTRSRLVLPGLCDCRRSSAGWPDRAYLLRAGRIA